ncbi:MAG: hypothetical protein ACI4LP_07520 [Anaerovoracaceae bacterium]
MLFSSITMSILCFALGLGIFVYLCFTKMPPIFSVLIAVLVMSLGVPNSIIGTIFGTLVDSTADVFKTYLAATMSGAVVGCAMAASGCANKIAETVMNKLGENRGVLVIVVSSALVCASGALGHQFIVLPIALAVCRRCNMSRGIALLAYISQVQIIQFSLIGIPAFPQLMPAEVLGITIYESSLMSITGCIIAEVLLYLICLAFYKSEKKRNHGFEVTPEVNVMPTPDAIPSEQLPGFWFSLLPLLFMIGGSLLLSNLGVGSTPSAVIAQVFTTVFLVITRGKQWHKTMPVDSKLMEFGETILNVFPMIINTAFIGGMGGVIATMSWYEPGIEWALGLKASPYLLCFIVVAAICFITSDGIAGMQMFLSTMAERFMQIPGISLPALHRVICATACTIESMPWTSSCYKFCAYFGLSVKTGWKYHFIGTVGITTFLALYFVIWSSIVYPC